MTPDDEAAILAPVERAAASEMTAGQLGWRHLGRRIHFSFVYPGTTGPWVQDGILAGLHLSRGGVAVWLSNGGVYPLDVQHPVILGPEVDQ